MNQSIEKINQDVMSALIIESSVINRIETEANTVLICNHPIRGLVAIISSIGETGLILKLREN